MDNMLFPENCSTLCIVPSNKEGTGFLNHCYDARFLTDFISEQEFNCIVAISSKICARAYSKKKMMDKLGVPKNTKLALIFSTLLAILSLVTILCSILYSEVGKLLLIVSHLLIAPSLMMMFIVVIYNWKREVKRPITFNELVKNDLEKFFKKVNSEFGN